MFGYLVSYPTICFYWLTKNRDTLGLKNQEEKCGKLYTNIAIYRKNNVIFYYPIFMYRRLFFVMIPIIFPEDSTFQIQFLVLFSSFYLIWYGSISPYTTLRATATETFNECIFMCLIYHLFLFSDWTTPQ